MADNRQQHQQEQHSFMGGGMMMGGGPNSAPCTQESMMSAMRNGMHDGHAGHAGHGGGGHPMTFHHSTSAVLLFEGFQVGPDPITYFLACAFIIFMGIVRQELVRMSDVEQYSLEKRAFLYFCQATISYLLMLIAMTFNVGLFFAVMFGLTAGHYRALVTQAKLSKSECCA